MRILFALLSITITLHASNESLLKQPDSIVNIQATFTEEFLTNFNTPESLKKCNEVWKNNPNFEALSESEKAQLLLCDETKSSPWEAEGGGCSWYCGGGPFEISATSTLASNNKRYDIQNIHDLNYKSAWVEGVKGYGIGEKITYKFKPESPRITEIRIVNGYVKGFKVWKANSRVKKLKVAIDGKLLAILLLEDSREEQVYKFEPIGNSNRKVLEEMKKLPAWELTFEILEVYPGDKYDDTVISEIYFDGIDVH